MEKTTKNGIHRIRQEGGKTIAWAEESGVKVLEKDGYYFKDLAKTGELLPYENWRLSDEERAADLAGRLSIEEIAGLMLYSPPYRRCRAVRSRERLTEKRIWNPAKNRMRFLISRKNFWRTSISAISC